jgi:IS30 family transposase
MARFYRYFTLEERRTLFRLFNAKLPIKEIASQLGTTALGSI